MHFPAPPENLTQILKAYGLTEPLIDIHPIGHGRIHDSFTVQLQSARGPLKFLLQCINTRVFPDLESLMHNTLTVTEELKKKEVSTLSYLLTEDGTPLWTQPEDNQTWRMMDFREGTLLSEFPLTPTLAMEAGNLLGRFHLGCASIDESVLTGHMTDHHETPKYWTLWDIAKQNPLRSPGDLAGRLESFRPHYEEWQAHNGSRAFTRGLCHNDPKSDNMLFHTGQQKGICLLDLDTCGWGLLVNDFGDAVRSLCAHQRENQKTEFASDLFKYFAQGYWKIMRNHMSIDEEGLFFEALCRMTLELALRYLTDYCRDNVYFKAPDPSTTRLRAAQLMDYLDAILQEQGQMEAFLRELSRK
jgi:N-acetylhexosamine 1-kinase